MDPSRKRRIRLVVSLSAAVLLAAALVFTSFSASSEAVGPGKLLHEPASSKTYKLVGKVQDGSLRVSADGRRTFRITDRDGRPFSVPVRYDGQVPDPFREGREVSVVVKRQGAMYVGEKDTLITKCPSKYTAS